MATKSVYHFRNDFYDLISHILNIEMFNGVLPGWVLHERECVETIRKEDRKNESEYYEFYGSKSVNGGRVK